MVKQIKNISQHQRNINSMVNAIKILTGLNPAEKITKDKYVLTLGIWNQTKVGYDKNRKSLTVDAMRYSALVAMLRVVSNMMKNELGFVEWLHMNNVFINKQN